MPRLGPRAEHEKRDNPEFGEPRPRAGACREERKRGEQCGAKDGRVSPRDSCVDEQGQCEGCPAPRISWPRESARKEAKRCVDQPHMEPTDRQQVPLPDASECAHGGAGKQPAISEKESAPPTRRAPRQLPAEAMTEGASRSIQETREVGLDRVQGARGRHADESGADGAPLDGDPVSAADWRISAENDIESPALGTTTHAELIEFDPEVDRPPAAASKGKARSWRTDDPPFDLERPAG